VELAQKEHRDYEPASVLLERILTERRARWQAEQMAKLAAQGRLPLNDAWRAKYPFPPGPDGPAQSNLPCGWTCSSIGQVSECLDSMRVPVNKSERAKRNGSVPYYGANGPVGYIDDYIYDEPLVLVVEDETFTGREKPFSYKIRGKSWVNNHAHVLRATGGVDIDYLNFSLAFYPFTPRTTGTTGRKKLTQGMLVSAPFALPPIAEQRRIVAEVERQLSIIDGVEATVNANLKRAERLRQSILQRAFSGKLVPQDPNDAPANVMLERIQAERGVSKPEKANLKRQKTRQLTLDVAR
jgi:type I restriction enzyme S subunit